MTTDIRPTHKTAIVIGGGIIGLCSAYYLLKDGWKVTLLDKGNLEFDDNCSQGNAGMIVPSHFTPLAAPGIVAQGIKWMFNSRSPFYVKPSLNRALISWGLKFLRHANATHVAYSAPFLRDLNLLSRDLYLELEQQASFQFGLKTDGILMLYKTEKTAEEEIHLADEAQKLGIDAQVLTRQQIREAEPAIELDVAGAVHYKSDGHLYPVEVVQQLIRAIKAMGADILTDCPVTGVQVSQGEIKSIKAGAKTYTADKVVMTGGAWLPELAKMAGLHIPVMPGKGYSFMTSRFEGKVKHPSLLLEARVAFTPMNGQVRISGTMEFAAINKHVNMNRVEGIVTAIPQYYKGYDIAMPEKKDVWYGFRPCSPDGLPYLGYSKKIKNLVIAGGHGMMGLSLGPATGKVVSELLNESELSTDVSAYRPERFS